MVAFIAATHVAATSLLLLLPLCLLPVGFLLAVPLVLRVEIRGHADGR
jgi:hypothetical protein